MKSIFTIISLCISFLLLAQCPNTNSIIFDSQQSLEDFAINYPNCTELSGRVAIGGSDITDLTPLSNVSSIGRYLDIRSNSALTQIDGLSNLSSIGGSLIIRNNSALTQIDGLSNLSSISGKLDIKNNSALTQIDGLSNLSSIDEYLSIYNNSALTHIDGLSNVSSIGEYLSIYNNSALTQIDGLSNLSSIGGYLLIRNNSVLTHIDGLSNVSSIGEYLSIYDNSAITQIDGLSNLSSIDGYLSIYNNSALTQIDGLSNLSSIGGYLSIYNNSALTQIDGLSTLSSIGGYLLIRNISALTQIDGLSNLSSIGGYLNIYDNSALTQIDGLSNVGSIGEGLKIYNNSALTQIDGLSNVSSIGGFLQIGNNSSLTQIDGLSNVSSIGGYLQIRNNSSLTQIDGLSNVSSIGGKLDISNNSALTQIDGLSNVNSIGLYLIIRNNPSLTQIDGLSNVNSIGRYTSAIIYNSALNQINGFSNLSSIGGNLDIIGNSALTQIDGFSNLSSIGGNLVISDNSALTQIDGLSNLSSIGGYLNIYDNSALTQIDGFFNLSSIGNLDIRNNSALTHIDGLSNLSSIGGNLDIRNNSALTHIDGLFNVNSIGGFLYIYNNSALTQINGLENIDPTSINSYNSNIEDIEIINNSQLSECAITSICDALSLEGTTTDIQNNGEGCNSQEEIEASCNSESPQCPEGDVIFHYQYELEAFANMYPDCTEIYGRVNITDEVTDLSPLANIETIGGDLFIGYGAISSLEGLANLQSVNGYLVISANRNLFNLNGLENLQSVGGHLEMYGNRNLSNIDGLENLQSINGKLSIAYNALLTSIDGIGNINPSSINNANQENADIHIVNNAVLAQCSIANICALLSTETTTAEISRNADGCNTQAQVLEGCGIEPPMIPEEEYNALIEIYNELVGSEWQNTWDISINDLHLRDWYGITVGYGHVTQINLSNNQLSGVLPNVLNSFTNLSSFNVASNSIFDFNGTVPEGVDVFLQSQTIDMGDVFLSSNTNLEVNALNLLSDDYTIDEQNFRGHLNSNYRNLNIGSDGINLTQISNLWTMENGSEFTLTQHSGAAQYSVLRFNLRYTDGDVNIDEQVNVLDLQTQINYIMQNPWTYFNYRTADRNADQNINVLDIVQMVTLLQNEDDISGRNIRSEDRTNPEAYIYINDEGIYLEPLHEGIASFELRLAGTTASDIQNYLSTEIIEAGYQVTIRETADGISLIAYTFGAPITGLMKIVDGDNINPTLVSGILSNPTAEEIRWQLISEDLHINEVAINEKGLVIYPNPFADMATVAFNSMASCQGKLMIYDSSSKLVSLQKIQIHSGQNQLVIDRNELTAGKYVVIIEHDDCNNTNRLSGNIIIK